MPLVLVVDDDAKVAASVRRALQYEDLEASDDAMLAAEPAPALA